MSEIQNDLLKRKADIVAGDKAGIEKQKSAGKLTARERIAMILDEGSFVELGALVKTCGVSGESVVAGYGTIAERPVYVYAQNFAVKAGAMSAAQAKKIVRVTELAKKTGAPVIAILDSAGAKIDEGIGAIDGYAEVIAAHAKLSGIVPQVAVVAGPCVGAAAIAVSMCDFVVMTEKVSALMMQGPQVISAKTGKDYTAQTLGGVAPAAKAGAAALCAESEDEAASLVKSLVSFLPSNNLEEAPAYDGEDINRDIASDGYDVANLVYQLADYGDTLELYADYGKAIYTAFAKVGGYSVGIIANNPAENGGVITPEAASKAAKVIGICDSFNIPVVSLVNTEGFIIDNADVNFASIQAGAKLAYAYAEATVAKISVITGKAVGGGYAVMSSKALGADITYAWPKAAISPLNSDAAVRILYGEEIKAGKSFAQLTEEYENGPASPFAAAETGAVDDVITPESTRAHIINAVDMLCSKREIVTPRKHGNQPL
ncbi:MAG: methylmalonyl-CoA carboxyltransferase [Clostridia bacterium]|nr:methylmalonyl-CoA carboxyltransferase [Clostridia bacterium]